MIGKTNADNFYVYRLLKGVPSDYQVVEYIESDGLSYIDTGLMSHSNMSCELKFEFVEVPDDGTIIGTKYTNSNRDRLYFYHYYKGHRLGYKNFYGLGVANPNELYLVKTRLDVGNLYIYINDDLVYQGNDPSYLNTRLNFYIFNLNTAGLEDKYYTKAKLYFCKIWEGDELSRYFIPVYRKEDNETGLFDIINQQFYINLGFGLFTSGPDSIFNIDDYNDTKI